MTYEFQKPDSVNKLLQEYRSNLNKLINSPLIADKGSNKTGLNKSLGNNAEGQSNQVNNSVESKNESTESRLSNVDLTNDYYSVGVDNSVDTVHDNIKLADLGLPELEEDDDPITKAVLKALNKRTKEQNVNKNKSTAELLLDTINPNYQAEKKEAEDEINRLHKLSTESNITIDNLINGDAICNVPKKWNNKFKFCDPDSLLSKPIIDELYKNLLEIDKISVNVDCFKNGSTTYKLGTVVFGPGVKGSHSKAAFDLFDKWELGHYKNKKPLPYLCDTSILLAVFVSAVGQIKTTLIAGGAAEKTIPQVLQNRLSLITTEQANNGVRPIHAAGESLVNFANLIKLELTRAVRPPRQVAQLFVLISIFSTVFILSLVIAIMIIQNMLNFFKLSHRYKRKQVIINNEFLSMNPEDPLLL